MTRDFSEAEPGLVAEFFGGGKGFFVEVGANDPHARSQTWHLEQAGWTGVLVEPLPDLAEKLKANRSAKVFAVACSSPENSGGTLPLYVAGPMSSLDRGEMAPGAMPETIVRVPIMTLDEILHQAGAPVPVDFVSIDVEGHERDVLRGFDLAHWRPRLVLLEDHVANLDKHRLLTGRGYKLVRRTGFNGWYVPAQSDLDFGWAERVGILRKYYLALPFRVFRNFSRRLRQPFKDRRAARDRAKGAR